MRHLLRVIAPIVLAALVAAPVSAVTPGGAADETLTGIVEQAYVELGDGRDHLVTTLRNRDGITLLSFARGDPAGLRGARVALTGRRLDGVLAVTSADPGAHLRIIEPARLGGTTAQASSPDAGTDSVVAKSIAVVLFNFTDLATTPFTRTQVRDAVVGTSTSVEAYYEEESKGRMTITAAVFGWYTINDTTAGCDWSTWHTLAWNAANADGANLASYTNVMFVFPNTTACGWAGLGYVPGRYTYLNGTISVQVMTHELGHNFGLSHSNAADCRVSGTRVMIAAPADCTTQGYADPFSTMGNNALRHNHGSHLGELGWLVTDEKVIGVPGNTYTITPYFGAAGLKLVRVPRGDGSYFDLDLRMPYGVFDTFSAGSPVVTGVSVRIGLGTASPTTSPKATLLLDATPGTTSLQDAPLAVGQTMTDPVSRLSITTVGAVTGGIQVRIRDGNAPGAPGSLAATTGGGGVALSWTAATDDTAVTGYRVSRDGVELVTTDGGATGWTDATAVAGATHGYAVAAVDGSANVGPAATVTVTVPGPTPTPIPTPAPSPSPDPTPTPAPSSTPDPSPTPGPSDPPSNDAQAPTTPENLVGDVTATTVALAWSPSTDDTGVVGYRVTRNGVLVATPASVTWKDTARLPQTTYVYTVAALDAVGHVSGEVTAVVTTLPDTTAPTKPRHFHKVSRSGRYVTFDWSPSTDNVGVVRYHVYRVGRSTPVATVTRSKARIATVRGAYYYVRAVDAAGNLSPRSDRVRGRR